ncbi:MAG: TetR/AcrR family transcriptional regulator [Syntrophaceticus sp.]|jgi:AcrR family transcriptional regulator
MDKAPELTKTQKKIIDAAIKVFSEKGFEGSTTCEIAREAGVAEGTIFRHFSTKKGILQGILLQVVENYQLLDILEPLVEMIEKGDGQSKIPAIITQLEEVMEQVPLLKLLFYEAQFHPEIQEMMVEKIVTPILDRIKNSIAKQQSTGEYRNFDAYLMAISIFSSFWGYLALMNFIPEQEYMDEENAYKQMLDIWLYGVINQ